MANPSGPETSVEKNKRAFDKRQLSTLIDMDSPEAVHKEVLYILGLFKPDFNVESLDSIFRYTTDLYHGHVNDYQACNTDYHNFRHITDTYLAMMRLLHGAVLSGEEFNDGDIYLGLTGALMHDTGMIQESTDTEGTGAKYTQDHEQLSIDFIRKHAATLKLSNRQIKDLGDIILCTDFETDIPEIDFSSKKTEFLGKMVGTADLIAQMADHTYLEKLLFLFHEFREAEIGDFEDEIDFLSHTLGFYKVSEHRFKVVLDNACRYMVPHFKARWGIDQNLYIISLEKQQKFLEKIMKDKNRSVYRELKRENIVKKVRDKFGTTGLRK